MMRNWKKFFAALLMLAMLLPLAPAAVAEGEEDVARFADRSWEEIVDEFLAEHHADPASVACGWCNTVTGEEHYHNADQYMVSGSMYKVPINMIFTEKVHNGEISWDTFIGGYRYEYCLHATIVDSNNDIAKGMWDYLGGYQPYRHILAPYMGEDPDTVDEKFYENNFFTPRQMIYALKLLATESERFPKLIDEMLQAEPNKYFKERAHDYDIAQKFEGLQEWRKAFLGKSTQKYFIPASALNTFPETEKNENDEPVSQKAETLAFGPFIKGLPGSYEITAVYEFALQDGDEITCTYSVIAEGKDKKTLCESEQKNINGSGRYSFVVDIAKEEDYIVIVCAPSAKGFTLKGYEVCMIDSK